MPVQCSANCGKRAILKRPKTGDSLCKECFFLAFETEVHYTITQAGLFKPGDYVAIGASGGKDSTVLAYIMKTLNDRWSIDSYHESSLTSSPATGTTIN